MADDATTQIRELVDGALRDVVPKALATLGVEPAYNGARERLPELPGQQIVSLLGFTGRRLRGCMTLVTEPDTALELRRPAVRNMDRPPDICDWVGELVNQLLGRLQNRVLQHGLELQMATPSTVRGETIRLVPEDSKSAWHTFSFERREVQVRLTLEFEPNFVWEPAPRGTDKPVGEGQAVIF